MKRNRQGYEKIISVQEDLRGFENLAGLMPTFVTFERKE
ncbi:Uncharacterized protein dnm_023150 [Desulfonema magnum]|uniref:Uncharacterized protein n=1 Tax=Desulfonema magnum TaxID=45655 RepID=A0A975GM41_9BACT|nr:Uncharacterized protein dnm_023150 [Desulfonema magnum]